MSKRVHFVMSEDLLARIDEARQDVPRGVWVRRAVEQALGSSEVPVGVRGRVPALPPAEQPHYGPPEDQLNEQLVRPPSSRVRSSAEARPFRPVPKKGEK